MASSPFPAAGVGGMDFALTGLPNSLHRMRNGAQVLLQPGPLTLPSLPPRTTGWRGVTSMLRRRVGALDAGVLSAAIKPGVLPGSSVSDSMLCAFILGVC